MRLSHITRYVTPRRTSVISKVRNDQSSLQLRQQHDSVDTGIRLIRGRDVKISSFSCHMQVRSIDSALAYVRKNTTQLGLHETDTLVATELCEGKINFVYRICTCSTQLDVSNIGPPSCFVLKHAPPYVKSMGKGAFALDQGRMEVEAAALARVHALCPQHCPRLIMHDAPAFVLVQEYLASHIKLSEGIHR